MTPPEHDDAARPHRGVHRAAVTDVDAPPVAATDPRHGSSWTPLLILLGLAVLVQLYLVRQGGQPSPSAPPAPAASGVRARPPEDTPPRLPSNAPATPPSRHAHHHARVRDRRIAPYPVVTQAAAAPVALLNVVALDFGRQTGGATVARRTVRVVNLGPTRLRVGSMTLTGSARSDFAAHSTCLRQAIGPDEGCVIVVSFSPGASGARYARLRIGDNTVSRSHTITLRGRGR